MDYIYIYIRGKGRFFSASKTGGPSSSFKDNRKGEAGITISYPCFKLMEGFGRAAVHDIVGIEVQKT